MLRILPCVGDRGKWYAFLSMRGSKGRNKERKRSVSERDSVSLQRDVLVHHALHLSYSHNQVHGLQLFITNSYSIARKEVARPSVRWRLRWPATQR